MTAALTAINAVLDEIDGTPPGEALTIQPEFIDGLKVALATVDRYGHVLLDGEQLTRDELLLLLGKSWEYTPEQEALLNKLNEALPPPPDEPEYQPGDYHGEQPGKPDADDTAQDKEARP